MHRQSVRIITLLSLAMLFASQSFTQGSRVLPSCPMNIIIAVDFSGSEMAYVDEIRTALHALTGSFELHETNLKIGIITFNRGAQRVLPLTSDTQKMDAVIEGMRITRMVYATDIHSAIDMANDEFRKHADTDVPKYLVILSDGDPHAHSRGYGFQRDLVNIKRLKAGDPQADVDPIHVFSLYTGRLSPYQDRFDEAVRIASIQHMQDLASDTQSFFFYEDYWRLVDFFIKISNCL